MTVFGKRQVANILYKNTVPTTLQVTTSNIFIKSTSRGKEARENQNLLHHPYKYIRVTIIKEYHVRMLTLSVSNL